MNINYIEKQLNRYESQLKVLKDVSTYALEKVQSAQDRADELEGVKEEGAIGECIASLNEAIAYRDFVIELQIREQRMLKEFIAFQKRAKKDLERMKK